MALALACITVPQAAYAEAEGDLSSWSFYPYNTKSGVDFSYALDGSTYRSGSHSVRVSYYSPLEAYHALQINQTVKVEPGKTYEYGVSVKAERAANVTLILNNKVRNNLLPLGSTFDWVDFKSEYTIPAGTTSLMFVLGVENITKNVWFDEVYVREKTEEGLGENLIKNPSFDRGSGDETKENIYRSAYYDGITKESMTLGEFKNLYGIINEVTIPRADGITIDGNLKEWEDYPAFAINVFDRMNNVRTVLENWGAVRTAYDDDYLYVAMDMYDTVHDFAHGGNSYWSHDSLQLAFCAEGDTYGQEIGFMYDNVENISGIYTSTASDEEISKIVYKATRDEANDMTYYEIAIPWEIYFPNGRPDSCLFCACINDNDGSGRNIADLRAGISSTKSSNDFMKLTFEEDVEDEWYVALAGTEKGITYEDTDFTVYLVNKGADKTVELVSEELGLSENVKIGHNEVVKKNVRLASEVMGNAVFKATAKHGDEVKSASFTTLFEPGEQKLEEILSTLDGYAAELKPMLAQCEEQNISTDYETHWYTILVKFTKWMRDDIDRGDLTRIGYNEEWLTKYYNQAKANLTAYLDGSATPPDVPTLTGGSLDITDNSVWAYTETDDGIEKRPVYLVGYIGYGDLTKDLNWQSDIATNMLFEEIVPADTLKQGSGDVPFTADLTGKNAQEFLSNLQYAEENNMRISVITSPHSFPAWFETSYKDLKYKGPGGSNLSQYVLAPAFRDAMEVHLRAVMEAIKDFENLDSICLSNETRHWTSANPEYYGPYWAYYLSQEYGADINKLNEAYGTNYTDFTEVEMPSKPTADRQFYDYYWFNCGVVDEMHRFMADIVHEYRPDLAIHAKVMPQMQMSDHSGSRASLQFGIDIDMYAEWAGFAGNDAMQNKGGDLLEKHMYYDWQHSIIQRPVFDSENHFIADSNEDFTHEQAQHVESDVWNGIIHNTPLNAMWNWSRNQNNSALWGGLLWRPDALEAIGRISLDANRLGYEIDALVSKEPDVAILYSTNSRIYNMEHMASVFEVYRAANMHGQKVEFISEKQIDRIHNYKLLVLPSTGTVDAATVDEVYKYAENGGKLLIFGENTMAVDGKANMNDAAKISYIKERATVVPVESSANRVISPTRAGFTEYVVNAIKEVGLDRVVLVDTATNERADEVEYCYVEYNGKLHINILNHTWEQPKTIKVVIDGKDATSIEDLRGMKSLEAEFTVEPYTPMFIRIEG